MLDLIKDFNGIHTQLFEYNDYTKYSKFSKTFNKLDTCKMFFDSEKLFSRILFDLSGKICIKVEEDLSIDLLNTTIDSISIEDFRFMLDLGTRYKQFNDLLKRVIEPSVDEINEQSDLKVTATPQKTGRKFTHIKFTIKQKQKPKTLDPKRDPNTPDFFIKMTDAQRHLFANKMSEMPEMGKYSQGTESYQQFAIRIADMLLEPEKFRELYPILEKAGFTS